MTYYTLEGYTLSLQCQPHWMPHMCRVLHLLSQQLKFVTVCHQIKCEPVLQCQPTPENLQKTKWKNLSRKCGFSIPAQIGTGLFSYSSKYLNGTQP